jgi:hypothetical protein
MDTQIPPVTLNADLSDKINGLIDTMNQQKNAICDAKCMRNKELQKLYVDYTSAKQNFNNGEKNVETAEKKYYLEDKGSIWYSNFKRTNAEKLANDAVLKIQTKFDSYYNDIKRNIDYYTSQLTYRKRMGQLLNNYTDKLETIETEEKQLDSNTNISKRLSKYYEKDLEWGMDAFYYIRYLYWILAIIIVFYVSWGFYKKKYPDNQKQGLIITLLCYIFVPLILRPFYRMVIQ